MRLVALLHALARLAEIAAGRSPAVRGFVLWLLRRAAAAARDFVSGEPDPAALVIGPAGNRPEDAMCLAASLRALAWQLEAETALLVAFCVGKAGGRALSDLRGGRAPAADVLKVLSAIVSPALCAPHRALTPDTS
jgi:hypothetical protein